MIPSMAPRRPSGRARPSGSGRSRRPSGEGRASPPPRDADSDEDLFEVKKKPARGPEWLPRDGRPAPVDQVGREVRRVVGELREGCSACPYRRLCVFAPVKLQIDMASNKGARHGHVAFLKKGLARLSEVGGDWKGALVGMFTGREKDALLAGCLLAEVWRKEPARLRDLVEYTHERCEVERLKQELVDDEAPPSTESGAGSASARLPAQPSGVDPKRLAERMFRGQVIRAASFLGDEEALRAMQTLLVLDRDEENRLAQYEAVGALALLIGRRLSGSKWIGSLERDASSPFRATFACRDPGNGAIDVFFPYRRGKRRTYLYLRRDRGGQEYLSSIDKVRVDSLLYRIFIVFESDESKTHRVFKELCRHLNVRAGQYNANHVLEGFQRLKRDDLLLLAIYAPALARAVGHYLEVPDLHLLVKFLYQLRSESGRKGERHVPAHEKVVASREEWQELVDQLGPEMIKEVYSVLFRLNSSYKRRVYTTPTYLKTGEVAYLLTALAGWNPKGLEIELKQGKKPLAFVAYGLQPPGKWSQIRVGKLQRARDRAGEAGREDIVKAADQGMHYMAVLHGFKSFAELAAAAAKEGWVPPERFASRVDVPLAKSEDEFTEYPEQDEGSNEAGLEGSDDELLMVVEDDQTDEQGRLLSRRHRRARDDDDEEGEGDESGQGRLMIEDTINIPSRTASGNFPALRRQSGERPSIPMPRKEAPPPRPSAPPPRRPPSGKGLVGRKASGPFDDPESNTGPIELDDDDD